MSEDAPHYGPMTEQRAREILGDWVDGSCLSIPGYVHGLEGWRPGSESIRMDEWFTADQLEAIAWWMHNKG
jgi:hypothetical protein